MATYYPVRHNSAAGNNCVFGGLVYNLCEDMSNGTITATAPLYNFLLTNLSEYYQVPLETLQQLPPPELMDRINNTEDRAKIFGSLARYQNAQLVRNAFNHRDAHTQDAIIENFNKTAIAYLVHAEGSAIIENGNIDGNFDHLGLLFTSNREKFNELKMAFDDHCRDADLIKDNDTALDFLHDKLNEIKRHLQTEGCNLYADAIGLPRQVLAVEDASFVYNAYDYTLLSAQNLGLRANQDIDIPNIFYRPAVDNDNKVIPVFLQYAGHFAFATAAQEETNRYNQKVRYDSEQKLAAAETIDEIQAGFSRITQPGFSQELLARNNQPAESAAINAILDSYNGLIAKETPALAADIISSEATLISTICKLRGYKIPDSCSAYKNHLHNTELKNSKIHEIALLPGEEKNKKQIFADRVIAIKLQNEEVNKALKQFEPKSR